jgi:hypothetical protein
MLLPVLGYLQSSAAPTDAADLQSMPLFEVHFCIGCDLTKGIVRESNLCACIAAGLSLGSRFLKQDQPSRQVGVTDETLHFTEES